jgi:anti-sigma regulatory factor (Ser/Thr protein kinase)
MHRGIDIGAARLDGTLITVDADEALSGFLVDGWPDFGSFVSEVGDMIRKVTDTGRPVKVFGEMVALLWDAGQVAAAIELEKVWNDFGDEVPFSLMCAYPAGSVTGDGTENAFLQVCQCHSAVFGADEDRWDPTNRFVVHRDELTRSFTGETSAIGAARNFVSDTLDSWGLQQLIADGAIVVSELATNAIIHAESDFAVSLSSHGDAVRLAVHDHSPAIPMMRSPLPVAISGRGLRLITALSRRWGTDLVSDGKVVWAELNG